MTYVSDDDNEAANIFVAKARNIAGLVVEHYLNEQLRNRGRRIAAQSVHGLPRNRHELLKELDRIRGQSPHDPIGRMLGMSLARFRRHFQYAYGIDQDLAEIYAEALVNLAKNEAMPRLKLPL